MVTKLSAEQQQAYVQLLNAKIGNSEANRCPLQCFMACSGKQASMCNLLTLSSRAGVQIFCSFLAEALQLPEYNHDARSSILLDYAAWLCM